MKKKIFDIFMSRSSKLCEMSREVIQKKNVRIDVCMCMLKLRKIQASESQELFGRLS